MLSTFETRLLERHLDGCAACRAFAADVSAQTRQLRAAPLELAPQLADIGRPAHRRGRIATFAATGAAAAAAAVLTLTPAHNAQQASASRSSELALFTVSPSQPTANTSFEVPRLEAVSPASADGPVRGYYGVPA